MSQQRSRPSSPELATAVRALHTEAETRALAEDLRAQGIDVLALKGPHLQERLYGTPAAYPSGDVDLLVRRADAPAARRILGRAGWRFEPENGVLWRMSRAATFERGGVRVDLHWGLHAAHLPAWTLRRLERSLWAGATAHPSGVLLPAPEPLLVFLGLHAAGHGFEREEWRRNVVACKELVTDWASVWDIARRARVEGAVRSALAGGPPPGALSLLDGFGGSVISALTWALRGHFLPRSVRDAGRGALSRFRPPRKVVFSGLEVEVAAGVFPPQGVTEGLVGRILDAVEGKTRPVVVDVGTGSGAVALAVASARPDALVLATDVSRWALRCAGRNAQRLGMPNVRLVRGPLLAPIPDGLRGRVDAVGTNVPYVPAELAGEREGDQAVVGAGPDGLGLLRQVAVASREFLAPGGLLALQLGDFQWEGFAEELRGMGYQPRDPDRSRPGRAVVASASWPGGAG